jgi:O-antigen/teichoic acid export membrane protein
LYNVATRFALPVAFVVNAVQASWVAYKFQIHAEDPDARSFFQSTLTYYVAALAYLWVGVSLWGPEAVRLMTAADFHAAATLVWAVSLVPVCQGMYYMSGTGIELSDNTRPFPLVSFAGLVTVVLAAWRLVPALGALGAALSTSLAWVAMGIGVFVLSQRRMAIAYDWATIGAFGVVAALFVAGGVALQTQPLAVRLALVVVMSVAYPLVCLALLLRSRDERGRVRHWLSRFRLAPSKG